MSRHLIRSAAALFVLTFAMFAPELRAQAALPNPIITFAGQEPFTASGGSFVRYHFEVYNDDAYPDTMFAAAPDLPPCGQNKNSSRTWIDLFDQSGKRLYGFCALLTRTQAGKVWFALPAGQIPPSWVYLEFNDRKTGTKYKSNLAETTL